MRLRAAASLLELEFRCPDRQFGFAINRADKICLFNIAVPSLQDLTPWPIFVGDSSDASALRECLLVPDILTEINARVEAELPLLPDHLRGWLETHLAHPREISVVSDPDGASPVRVWLVTDHVGDSDASSRVVYEAAQKAFGLVTELQNGVLWYMGPYGSLVDTVNSL